MLEIMLPAMAAASQAGVTVIPAPPAPPLPVLVSVPERTTKVTLPIAIRVRVLAGTQQLFNDTLRVSSGSGASYSETRSEAPDIVCPTPRSYGGQERSSFTISLYQRDDRGTGPSVNVSVRWQRPTKPATCGGDGTREVQLNQTVPLAPGQSTTVQGDAGLSVTISR